ncbi:DUF2927 domain-containing protein [Rhodoplanes azumiensis]|uniref:DUF2927 domain-containing protein n=1 Tax=Rhodoplanes azumiensis TaxID=1897628 RepID=A0ABW5AG18_9BRAD
MLLSGVTAFMALAAPLPATAAEPRPAASPVHFTDRQILRGFLAVAFGAEYATGATDRIRRFDGPVRVFVDATGAPPAVAAARTATAEAVVAEIGRGVQHLDIATTRDRAAANLTVVIVRRRALAATVTDVFGPGRAKTILRRLRPDCLSGFVRDDTFRIRQAAVILVADTSDFIFRDCTIEETLQALGPIDDTRLPWTMFNDAVRTGRFGRYDRYLLGLLYHPRMRPGTTRHDAVAIARSVLPEVRAFVDNSRIGTRAPSPKGTAAAPRQ